jgi:hypothetical protein
MENYQKLLLAAIFALPVIAAGYWTAIHVIPACAAGPPFAPSTTEQSKGCWDFVTAVATAVATVAAIGFGAWQAYFLRKSLQNDTLLKLEDRFNSPDFIRRRMLAAKAILKNRKEEKENPANLISDVDDVLDFMDTIGLCVRKGALDKEAVWNTFGYWVRHYWSLSSAYIEKMNKTKPSIWADFTSLQKKLNKIELRKRGIVPEPTDPDLEKFLHDEIKPTA